jgi:hypothetical protein
VHLHTHLSVDPLLRNFSVANVFPSCRMCSFAREVQFPSSTGTTPSLQQYEGGGIRIRVHAGASPVYHTQLQFRQQSAGWSGTLSTAQWSDAKEQLRSPSGGQKRVVEKLWREFFSDPSQWWDHRSEKVSGYTSEL